MSNEFGTRPTLEDILEALREGNPDHRRFVANRIEKFGIAFTPAATKV